MPSDSPAKRSATFPKFGHRSITRKGRAARRGNQQRGIEHVERRASPSRGLVERPARRWPQPPSNYNGAAVRLFPRAGLGTDDPRSHELIVVIVGGGPSGLAAIDLKRLAAEHSREVSVCILEKGSEVEPRPYPVGRGDRSQGAQQALPSWQTKGAPITTPVSEIVLILTADKAYRTPSFLPPLVKNNHGNYIVSLGNVCRWLSPAGGSPGGNLSGVSCGRGPVRRSRRGTPGVATGDMGVAREGTHKPEALHGIELRAKYALLRRRMPRLAVAGAHAEIQPAGWDRSRRNTGSASRSSGRSHRGSINQGSFSTARAGRSTRNRAAFVTLSPGRWSGVNVGFVVHLDYRNPHLSPFDEFQRFKTRPAIRPTSSKAASGSRTAPAPSTKAACNRCRRSCFPAAR